MSSDLLSDVLWINSTAVEESETLGVDSSGEVDPILAFVALVCLTAALSQIVVVLIARGLEGDYSARTFMWVHALAQACQQLAVIYLALSNATGYLIT